MSSGVTSSARTPARDMLDRTHVTRRLLDKVRAGELGRPPQAEGENIVRTGWL